MEGHFPGQAVLDILSLDGIANMAARTIFG